MKTTDVINPLSYSEIKSIYNQLDYIGLDNDEIRQAIDHLSNYDSNDFESGNYRLIITEDIDEIMQDELESDEYILGCFNSWFISDSCDIDIEVVEALQESDKYDVLGRLILKSGNLKELQSEYVRLDGYGHHFNHYDGNQWELNANNTIYHVFKIG